MPKNIYVLSDLHGHYQIFLEMIKKIHFTDDDTIHSMEEIYNSGADTFMQYYNQVRFKCTKVEHHDKTKLVSYLFFEQIAT